MTLEKKVEWSFSPPHLKKANTDETATVATPQTKFWNEPANPLDSSFSLDTFTSILDYDRCRIRIEHILETDSKIYLYGSNTCVVVEGRWTEIVFQKGMWIDVFVCVCCNEEDEFDDVSMTSIDFDHSEKLAINNLISDVINSKTNLKNNSNDNIDKSKNVMNLKNDANFTDNSNISKENIKLNPDSTNLSESTNLKDSSTFTNYNDEDLKLRNRKNEDNHTNDTIKISNDTQISLEKYKKRIYVNDYQNLLTIESDIISVTTFIKAFKCKNEPYISKMILDYNFNYKHPSLAIGTIIHTAIQNTLHNFNRNTLVSSFKNVIAKSTTLLYCCNIDERHALNECVRHLKTILRMESLILNDKDDKIEIEKKICCNKLSLRGKIDISIGDVAIEIKTGKPNAFDTAQLVLYVLISGQSDAKLFYTATGEIETLQLKHSIVRDLLVKRASVVLQEPVECCCSPICTSLTKNDAYIQNILGALEKEHQEIKKVEAIVVSQNSRHVTVDLTGTINYTIDKYVTIYTKSGTFLVTGKIKNISERRIEIELNDLVTINTFVIVCISVEYCEIFYRTVRYAALMCAEACESYFQDDQPITSMENNDSVQLSEIYSDKNISECSVDTSNESECKDEYEFSIPVPYKDEFYKLNEYQRNALFQCLNTKKYHLVHGMPGTGKTSVIALLIKILSFYKKKILIVCYTNLSLKNICSRINEQIFYTNSQCVERIDAKSVAQLRSDFNRAGIVASTCFSLSHPIFIERKFDFLVIDEGSQIHLPLAFMPMSRTERVVVFGDHLQLKPLAKSDLLRVSVFEALMCQSKYGKCNVKKLDFEVEKRKIMPKSNIFDRKTGKICHISTLRIQYRMAKEIMRISNTLFYFGKMICGTNHHGLVRFIDTSVSIPVDIIKKCNVVLCYFNTQVGVIRQLGGVAETIDRFQGSEADRVVVCFDPVVDCEVMRSRERLNVALTRAKVELVCIGDVKKMRALPIFKSLLELCNF